jgi:hypothetical protein
MSHLRSIFRKQNVARAIETAAPVPVLQRAAEPIEAVRECHVTAQGRQQGSTVSKRPAFTSLANRFPDETPYSELDPA